MPLAPPNWARLRSDEDWRALWLSEESPLREYVERMENQLRNGHDDHVRMLAAKYALQSLHWLRNLVETKADEPSVVDEPLVKERSRVRSVLNHVLPLRLG